MRRLWFAVIAVFAMAHSVAAIAQTEESDIAHARHGFLIRQVQGSLPGGGSFTGSMLIDKIAPEGLNSQQVRVIGRITGTVVKANNKIEQINNERFSAPATLTSDTPSSTAAAVTCSILHLDLGPINLNVLGLMLTTNEIVINLTAIQDGGLLGSLLCSLANALAGGTPLSHLIGQINHLLNHILATL